LGEFGYELISIIPYAYYLHKKNKLKKTSSGKDSSCLYYFSPDHEEIDQKRDYIIPKNVPMNNIHVHFLPKYLWEPPPYKDIYKNSDFVYEKPLLVICNKYNQEWGHPPITFFSLKALASMFDALSPNYQIVYCRPTSRHITDDGSEIYDLKDYDFIKNNYPNILLIQDIADQHPDLSFNEVQLKLFANTDRFISVQGGYSILCSYFKGINIVYGAKSKLRTADEIVYKAYGRWYHFFSGAKVVYADSYEKVSQKISELF
jgi:hypothetical protein